MPKETDIFEDTANFSLSIPLSISLPSLSLSLSLSPLFPSLFLTKQKE